MMVLRISRNFRSPLIHRGVRTCKVGVIGVPFDKGQNKEGVRDGPKAIRNFGLISKIKDIRHDLDVKDYGDVNYKVDETEFEEIPNMKEYAHMAVCNFELSKKVHEVLLDSRTCISLGGDHSIAIGTVDGHARAHQGNICVLWVDAHADLNTNITSMSGHIHGMPMALLVKELQDFWPKMPGMDWQMPMISIRNVAYIGLRSIDTYERVMIEEFGVAAFGIKDVEQFGISSVVKLALDRIDPKRTLSIHVSCDIDALDSLEAPSTGTPVRGGLTLRECIYIMETIYKTGRLGAMDLVEINPAIGSPTDVYRTVEAATHLILAACGAQRRGVRPYKSDKLPIPIPGHHQ